MLALGACSERAPTPDRAATSETPAANATQAAAGPSADAIEAAKTALRAEPKVKDLTYNADDAVQWHIGVLDDGSNRIGYAQYVCELLKEKGALAGRTHVRIVDIAKVAQGIDFRSASLGHVICETGDVVDP
ncbi:hypothetical protein CD928_03320 [Sphingopyxis sp. GW247-27LB]|nr:hypothetical protein CD928_03320 [Sphingopyxis sp. GW247-27LB]